MKETWRAVRRGKTGDPTKGRVTKRYAKKSKPHIKLGGEMMLRRQEGRKVGRGVGSQKKLNGKGVNRRYKKTQASHLVTRETR